MADVVLNLVFLVWRKLPVRALILCPLFISSTVFAANEELRLERFKVTSQKGVTIQELFTQLRMQPQGGDPDHQMQTFDAAKYSPPSEKGESADLQIIGAVGLDTSMYKRADNGRVTAKDNKDISTHFYSNTELEITDTTPVESKNVHIHRFSIFDKNKVSKSFIWATGTEIVRNAWDLVPSLHYNVEHFTYFLYDGKQLRALRDQGHEGYEGSGAFTKSDPDPKTGLYNADIPVDPSKEKLQDLRLSVIEQQIHSASLEVRDKDAFYPTLLKETKKIQQRLQERALIDDMLGVPVDAINVLICSVPDGAEATTRDQFSPSKTYRLLGFEYVSTPNSVSAQAPTIRDVRWDILEGNQELLFSTGWQQKHLTRRPTKRTRMGGINVMSAIAAGTKLNAGNLPGSRIVSPPSKSEQWGEATFSTFQVRSTTNKN